MTGFVSNDPLDNLTNLYQRPIVIPANRLPTTKDIYPPCTLWILSLGSSAVIYITTGQGIWFPLISGPTGTFNLTGNAGGEVAPTDNNIFVLGDGNNVTTVGIPGTSTININLFTPIAFFTPTIFGSTTSGTTTYSVQSGTYSRIGNIVYAQLSIAWTATTGTGDLTLTGFPYNFGGAQPRAPVCTAWIENMTWPTGVTYFVGVGGDATKNMVFPGEQTGAPAANLQMQASGIINLSVVYITSDTF